MLCRLCLQNTSICFNFFESEGILLNAVAIVGKYFWFQPDQNDKESHYICRSCWSILESFNSLYILVENAHKQLNFLQKDAKYNKSDARILNVNEVKKETEHNCIENSFENNFSSCKINQDSISNLCQYKLEISGYENFNEIQSKSQNVSAIRKENVVVQTLTTTAQVDNGNSANESKNIENGVNCSRKKRGRPSIVGTKIKSSQRTSYDTEMANKITNEVVSDEEISKMKRIMCHICMLEIPTFLQLKKHFVELHDEDGYAVCCNKKFYKRYKFVHHLKMHLNPNEYKCPHCEKQLGSKKYISLHIKNMHTKIEKVRNFSCEVCSKSFVQNGALVRHMLTHVPDNEKIFQCDQCGKSYPTQGVLKTHKNTVHEGRYGGICALCGKKYQNPQDLKRHNLEHEGISEPKAQCDVCGDWLANKYKLKRHMIKHNTAHLEHKCPHCNKLSPNEIALKTHIRFTHSDNNRIHQCHVCEKAFKRKIDLKEHITVHTGEHLYSCPHCIRTFTHHSNLHHHRKKRHRKEFDEERLKRGINKTSLLQV